MSPATTRARATTAVTVYQPTVYDQPEQGPALNRIHVEETFAGDLEAVGVTEFLLAAQTDGSASFVGLERVDGALAGRRGTFLFQSVGSIHGNLVSASWTIVPGSGTGELSGLHGSGSLRSELGQGGDLQFDYSLDLADVANAI
jgi:hypothetical protein